MTNKQDYIRFLKDFPDDPTPLQRRLMAEVLGRYDILRTAGYKTIGPWLRHQERDITDGRREPPSIAPAPKPSTTTSLSTSSDSIERVDFVGGGGTVGRLNRLSDVSIDQIVTAMLTEA